MSDIKKPCVLITGAAGATAQQVISRLRHDCQLVVCDSRREVSMSPDIPSYHIDLNKRGMEDIFRKYRFDAVIHLGRMAPNEYTRDSRYNANVLGTQRLFDLCVKYGVGHVIVMSTHFVYGAHAFNPAFLGESSPLKASELTMDLVDSVELENLSMIYLWKYPELNMTILRPCNIVGPGVNNTMSLLLMQERAPVLAGFSPIMQFIHVEDMADATVLAFHKKKPGIYNVAPDDCVAYQKALELAGCKRLSLPSVPPGLPRALSRVLGLKYFPHYLVSYFKYAATIDGSLFRETFGFEPRYSLKEIFAHYKLLKQ
jgi:UDP-glucose 4-epimerase